MGVESDALLAVVGILLIITCVLTVLLCKSGYFTNQESNSTGADYYVQMKDMESIRTTPAKQMTTQNARNDNSKWNTQTPREMGVTQIRELAEMEIKGEKKLELLDPSKITLDRILGRGAEGVVRAGVYNGQEVAVKVIDIQGLEGEEQRAKQMSEVYLDAMLMLQMDHKCIVNFYGLATLWIQEEQAQRLMLVMERGELSLDNYIYSDKYISMEEMLQLLLQVNTLTPQKSFLCTNFKNRILDPPSDHV